jgi:hypothetical protein
MIKRAPVLFAILASVELPVALADPPSTSGAAPESQSTTAESSTGQSNPAQAAPAQPAATVAASPPETRAAAPATPAPSASGESLQKKQLRAQGYLPRMINGEKLYCRPEIPTGSRLANKLNCQTAAEADVTARDARSITEHLQKSPGCILSGKSAVCK